MPSIQARMLNKIFQKMPKDPPGVEHDFVAEREQNARRKPPKLPRNVSLAEMDFDGISGEILRPVLGEKERFEGNTDDLSEPVQLIWYIHGGGFTTGSARESRDLTQYLVSKYRVPCIATNYRLSPEHRWPAHLDDCMKVYQCLKDRGATPGKILLMGASAGGTLALSLSLRLAMEEKEQPLMVAALSAWTDQTLSLPSHTKNIDTDYMLGDALGRREQFQAVFGIEGPKGHDDILKNPLVSPFYGNYTKTAPIFFAASDSEFLYDDSRLLYERLKGEGHLTELDIQHDVCHAYASLPMMPEAKDTLDKMWNFAHRKGNKR